VANPSTYDPLSGEFDNEDFWNIFAAAPTYDDNPDDDDDWDFDDDEDEDDEFDDDDDFDDDFDEDYEDEEEARAAALVDISSVHLVRHLIGR